MTPTMYEIDGFRIFVTETEHSVHLSTSEEGTSFSGFTIDGELQSGYAAATGVGVGDELKPVPQPSARLRAAVEKALAEYRSETGTAK